MKTYENWTKGSLHHYLQVGDLVDQEMVDYFINAMPPACWTARLVQMGEPYSHVNGRATYTTLYKDAEGWKYAGHCHRGQTN